MAGTNGLDWRLDIGRTRSLDIVGMPLLDHHVTTLGPTLLASTDILYINHLISDSLMVARGFKRLGARLISIAIPYSGTYGPVQRAVHEGFKHLGPPSCPGSPTPASPGCDVGSGPVADAPRPSRPDRAAADGARTPTGQAHHHTLGSRARPRQGSARPGPGRRLRSALGAPRTVKHGPGGVSGAV